MTMPTIQNTRKNSLGAVVIGCALFLFLKNMGGAVADLKEWHGVQSLLSQEVVGEVLSRTGEMGLSMIGGLLITMTKKDEDAVKDPSRFHST